MERSRIRQLIRNQNTKRTDESAGNKSRKEDCGKIHENVPSVYCVAVLSHYTHLNTYELYKMYTIHYKFHIFYPHTNWY